MAVPSPRVEGPQDSFASTANTIFASNPRILEEQKQQWREEKGLSGLWDPNKDPRRAPSPRSPEERAGRPVAAPLRRRGVPQSWVDEEMGEQDQPLLRQVPSTEAPRDDFHRCRWRCIWQPERAVETLGAVAQLQLSIVRGKDLACHELSSLFQPTCNAAAKVYLDDTLVCQSKCQQRTRDPDWKFQKSLDVTCPYSMLRVHVVDFGNSNAVTRHQIGFVEINLGDLPLNKELIGWFELRHPDALKRTSWERYATHCQRRDDQMPRLRKPRVPVQKLQQESQEFSPDGNDTLNTSGQRSFLGSCASYLGRSTAELQRQVSEAIKPEERENAGEILLRLRLSYLDRARDSFFAKALQPACVHHGTSILQADSDSDFHLQHLWDDVIDVKQQVLQDAVSSTANFFRYILHWRSNILSAILLVSLTGPLCYSALFPHPRNLWLWTAVVPGVIALLHLLLSISSARAFMLQGGTNAPLTQEGFVRTAAWRDTEQMVAFIDRVVLDTNGCVCDQRELRSFAARCFRDGKPRLTLGELRTGLKASNWVSFDLPAVPSDADGEGKTLLREGCPSTEVQPGDLVLVDGKRRAWVTRLAPSELVVEYEDMEEVHSKQPEVKETPQKEYEMLVASSPRTEERTSKHRVSLRPRVPTVPQQYLPVHLAGEIYSLSIIIDDLKTLLCPALRWCGDVLCWRHWKSSLALLFVLPLVSAASTAAFVLECCMDSTTGAAIAKSVVRWIVVTAKLLLVAALLSLFCASASWFVPIRSLLRIAWRSSCGWRRTAPKHWAFFRVESQPPEVPAQGQSDRSAGHLGHVQEA